jgi:hypothetical protein
MGELRVGVEGHSTRQRRGGEEGTRRNREKEGTSREYGID